MKKLKKIIYLLFIAFAAFFGYKVYVNFFTSNIIKSGYIYIPHGATLEQVSDSLKPFVKNISRFQKAALKGRLKGRIKPGRYKINENDNNYNIVQLIKLGQQTPENFRIIDYGSVYEMVGRVTKKTEIDSAKFVKTLDSIAQSKGLLNAEDLKPYFFVDTYKFFWTVKPSKFFNLFWNEYNKFWTPERKAKADALGLTRAQIYALASIVYKESGGAPNEQKTIAGLYLNRYKKQMKLQSDPTVIYAIDKENHFQKKRIKRVYYKYLGIDSPYNTYKFAGLPPGPICIVDKNTLEAVLNAEDNKYIYMCADPERPGHHKFTDSDKEHAENAKAYQQWLNKKQIK